MMLLATSGLTREEVPRTVAATVRGLRRSILESGALKFARISRDRRGLERFDALSGADVWCWEADGTSPVSRCRLGDLRAIFGLTDLHPEGEIEGVAVSGAFIFELSRAEREVLITISELSPSDVEDCESPVEQ